MSEEVKAKVDNSEELSIAEKETKTLEKAGFDTKENVYKVDLRSEPNTQKDAIQEPSTEEVSVRDEPEVSEEISEENNESTIEKIAEESSEESIEQEVRVQAQEEEVVEKEKQPDLPEGVEKLLSFLKDNPGADLEDYVRLNADYTNVSESALLQEYYKQTKKHLSREDIDFLLEDNFSYDESLDDERAVKRKKLAYKEEVEKARNFLNDTKEKYYSDIKLKSGLSPEQQEATDFFNRYKNEQSSLTEKHKKQSEVFDSLTNKVFNEEFKGFEFKVNNNNYRYNIKDAASIKQQQSDVMNVLGSYLDENNTLKDAKGYHKALFAAKNADGIANHFYEQGKADAIRELNAKSKNINMDVRASSDGVINAGGMKVKAISGTSGSKLRVKFSPK